MGITNFTIGDKMDKRLIVLTGAGLALIAAVVVKKGSAAIASCPMATQDSDLNSKNRLNAKIRLMYGPFPDSPSDFWQKLANKWGVSLPVAKSRVCGNCVAYDQSPRMKKCMNTTSNNVGYCWMHHFKCKSTRTCQTWVAGGPITSDKVSFEKSGD